MVDHDNIGRPTDHGPAAIRARFDAASQHVADLCSGKERWTLRIPAQPGWDSDLVIANALEDIPRLLDLLAELAGLRAALASVREIVTTLDDLPEPSDANLFHLVIGRHDMAGRVLAAINAAGDGSDG